MYAYGLRQATCWSVITWVALTLAGCGGGGSGSSSGNTSTPTVFSAQAYLKAPNAHSGSWYGNAVAISGDTVVVGALFESSNQTTITNGTSASSNTSASGAGAAYVLKRTGTTWTQEAYLKAPNAEADDNFGYSVGIDGDTIVVGAIGESSTQTTITNGTSASSDNTATGAGAAYVFKRTGSTWAQEAYIKASNASTYIDSNSAPYEANFGWSVGVSGDTLVVGAPNEASSSRSIINGTGTSTDSSSPSTGAAFVYKRTGTSWAQQAYIKAANTDGGDAFGVAVAISSDTLVVGANGEESNQTTITNGTTASANNSASLSGAAYVYKRTGNNWAQEAYLKAPNADAGDSFGFSVAIDGNTLVVGAKDEASNQTTITNGTTASADNSAFINSAGTNYGAGAAYVFQRTGTTWAQQAYLKASNAGAGDNFGYSVGIYGDTVVVGAFLEDSNQTTLSDGTSASADNSANGAGAAYVFKRTGTSWAQEAYLKAPNAEAGDQFGFSVAVGNGTVVVGAVGEKSNQITLTNGSTASSDNSASSAGAAYVFLHQ